MPAEESTPAPPNAPPPTTEPAAKTTPPAAVPNAAVPNAAVPATELRWQFSLRDLLWVSLAVTVASGAASWLGPATLILSGALILLLMNHLGFFRPLQSPGRLRIGSWLITIVFAVSLGCPAMRGCNNSQIYGWQTAAIVVQTQGENLYKVATQPEDRQEALQEPHKFAVVQWYLTCLSLANLLLATAWLAPRFINSRWAPHYACVTALSAMSVAQVAMEEGRNKFAGSLIGAWLWMGAMTLLMILVPMPRRALAVAMLSTLLLTLVHVLSE
ncbi:MAG: hypothetical protein U0935_24610 [Pirellulales bacterium]